MSTVRLRLSRWGSRGEPFYGIVAAPLKSPRDRKFLETLGTYHAKPDSNGLKHVEMDIDRIRYWLGAGAKPTERVAWLLEKANIMPPTAGQLHRQREFDPRDPTTWKVMYLSEDNTVLAVESNSDAERRVRGTVLEAQIPSRLPDFAKAPGYISIYGQDIKLVDDNSNPLVETKGKLTEEDRLRLLRAFMEMRS